MIKSIMLTKVRNCWNGFWFRKVPPHSLAAFRIFFGAYLLGYFLRFAPNVELMFSNRGVYVPFLLPDLALPLFWAWLMYLVTVFVLCTFILGFRTRLVTPLVLLLFLYYYFLNFAVNNTSFDRLNIIFLIILCFADLDKAWSIQGEKSNVKDHKAGLVSIWAIRLITIQVAFLYFGAGFWKLLSSSWRTGEMMRWTLTGPWGTDLAFFLVKMHPPAVFFDLLTWSVIFFELTLAFALFSRRFQFYAFVIGFLFHLSIALLLNIPEFMNCVCTYVLFVDPKTAQRYGNSVLQKIGTLCMRLAKD